MWTKEARIQHVPRKECYPSDMTDMEWAITCVTCCVRDAIRGIRSDTNAAKKAKGIKRNVIVDTIGLLLGIAVIPADIQDRDCAASLIRKTRCLLLWSAKLFADGGYAGASSKRLQGGPSTVGRRANIILAATQSTPDGSLRSVRPHRRRLCQARNDRHHAQAAHAAKDRVRHVKF